jgi:ATP-binding cassette, subfamily B, bacterial
MRDGLRSALLVISLTFRADFWRAGWLVLRTPVKMCTVLATAYGLKLLADGALAGDMSMLWLAIGLLVAGLTIDAGFGVGSLSWRAMVIEKTSLLIDQRVMQTVLSISGLAHHEVPKHRDQLELLRLRRGELGEFVDTVSHNLGIILLAVGSIFLLVQIHPLLILLPLAGLPSLWATPKAERMKVRAQEQVAETLRTTRHLFEVGTGAAAGKEIRLFGLGDTLRERHRRLWDRADRVQNRAAWLGSALAGAGWLAFAVAYGLAIGFVGWLAVRGEATAGDMLMALRLAAGLNGVVQGIVFLAGWLVAQLRTAGRLLWLMDYAGTRAAAEGQRANAPDQLVQGITFDDVTFRYPETEADVLKDLSITLPAGSTVAVVGENGAGKSTLVKLLARFYDPTSGRVLVDGVDLRHIDPAEWRQKWTAGFQDFAKFELLVSETVGVGDLPRIDDESAVQEALQRASANDVAASLPDGMATQLGRTYAEGVELSGGQWQKLALGRGMMRQAPLVVALDEPTASLDAETEHELFERYAATARRAAAHNGAITVLVSHRFSTVRMADLILVINDGRLVEAGSHDELMARRGSYAELFELQARGYR